MAFPKPFEDHSYGLPNIAPAVAAELVDAAVQVGKISCINCYLHISYKSLHMEVIYYEYVHLTYPTYILALRGWLIVYSGFSQPPWHAEM